MSVVTAESGVLSDSASAAYFPSFVQRVQGAAVACALAVLAESSGTTNHAARASYARVVLLNPTNAAAQSIVWAVVADFATNTGSTDQQIADRVAAIWDALSFAG